MVNNSNSYNMNWYLQIILALSLLSCQENKNFNPEDLVGKWESINKNHPTVVLEFSKKDLYRYENGKKFVYNNYLICGDTLILSKSNSYERHLIETLNENSLKLGAINPYVKDIELIEALDFIRVRH